jgi:hypothetical protein
VKLGPKITAWRSDDIAKLLEGTSVASVGTGAGK